MTNKGFADNQKNIETPNGVSVAEKPLKTKQIRPQRVDINILKSKLQENESKEFKKNIYILSTLVGGIGVLGIYLSLWEICKSKLSVIKYNCEKFKYISP